MNIINVGFKSKHWQHLNEETNLNPEFLGNIEKSIALHKAIKQIETADLPNAVAKYGENSAEVKSLISNLQNLQNERKAVIKAAQDATGKGQYAVPEEEPKAKPAPTEVKSPESLKEPDTPEERAKKQKEIEYWLSRNPNARM